MLAGLLAQKILSLFVMIAMGAAMVKFRIIRAEDSRVASLMTLYMVTPCAIISAFEVEYTPAVRDGLFLAFAAAIFLHIGLIAGGALLARVLHLDPVEKASVIYSNSANFIIPLVAAVLGKEWVIYSIAFVSVQTLLIWTHCIWVLQEKVTVELKRLLLNVNMLAVPAGLVLFFGNIRLPGPVYTAVDAVGSMIGPMAMFVTGCLIATIDLRRLVNYRRVWLATALRLVAVPLACCAFLRLSGLADLVPNGASVLLVSLLATASGSASAVTQMAQIFGKDARYASAINVVSTALTIVTMPLVVAVYQFPF